MLSIKPENLTTQRDGLLAEVQANDDWALLNGIGALPANLKFDLIHEQINEDILVEGDSINVFIKFPCMCSFNLLISTIPFISILLLVGIFGLQIFQINIFFLNTYLFPLMALIIFLSMIVVIFETCRIFLIYKKKLFKIFVLLSLSVFVPGLGQIMKPFLNWKIKRKIWTQ